MRLLELFEAADKHVTFCFGRMNPPTIGHEQVFNTMASVGGDFKIFVSQSQDKKENPLDYGTKTKFIKLIHPDYAENLVIDPGLNTIGKVASYLYEKGYRNATFVAGSDRLASFQKLLTEYNGVEGKAHGYYKFNVLDFKSSGERDPDSSGVSGVSASKAREKAATGDLKGFSEATGAGQYANELYLAVRKGMGIKDNVTEARMSAQVKLQRAWEREQAKSAASRKRGQELLNPPKKEEPKKEVNEAGFLNFLKTEPPKKKWDPAKDSRVPTNYKNKDDDWIKLLIDKHRRGIELTDREWNSIEQWKLKRAMMKDDVEEHIVKVKGGYELKSKHGNKNLGKYPTKAGAEKRERQVQYFKHKG